MEVHKGTSTENTPRSLFKQQTLSAALQNLWVYVAHVPHMSKKKLDAKSENYIFLGYSEESKAYQLYNPKARKILTNRDVVFDEEQP